MTQVNSLALSTLPNLPPGTLPPVVLPFDPTSTTPVCVVALDSENGDRVDPLRRRPLRGPQHGHGRSPGAVAPVVFGGKIRAVMVYLDRDKMQARGLSPLDVMKAVDNYNVFLPTGDAKFGDMDYAIDSNSMFEHVEEMARDPAADRARQPRLRRRRGRPGGRQLHPDEHRARQRPPPGVHPGLPAARGQHAEAWSTRSRPQLGEIQARLSRATST